MILGGQQFVPLPPGFFNVGVSEFSEAKNLGLHPVAPLFVAFFIRQHDLGSHPFPEGSPQPPPIVQMG